VKLQKRKCPAMARTIVTIAAVLWAGVAVAGVDESGYMGTDGRTLQPPALASPGKDVYLHVRVTGMTEPYKRYILRYRVEPAVRNPVMLEAGAFTEIECTVQSTAKTKPDANQRRCVAVPESPKSKNAAWLRFIIPGAETVRRYELSRITSITYNLLEALDTGAATGEPPLTEIQRRIIAAAKANDALARYDQTDARALASAAAKSNLEAARKSLSVLQDRAKQFVGIASEAAVARVAELQAEIDRAQDEVDHRDAAAKKAEMENQAGRKPPVDALADAILALPPALREQTPEERKRWASQYSTGAGGRILQLRRVGAVLVGTDLASFPYRLRYGATAVDVTLEPAGDPQPATQDYRLYLHVLDRIPAKGSYDLTAKLDVTPGAAPNSDPWRPTFPGGFAALAAELTVGATTAYADELISLNGPYRGNDKLKLDVTAVIPGVPTATSETTTTTAPGQPPAVTATKVSTADKQVTLLSTNLPQIHALYRFQVLTGAVLSMLRDQKGVRDLINVTTTTGTNTTTTTATGPNGTTTTVTQTPTSSTTKTYQDRLVQGKDSRVLAFAGFGATLRRVDPQKKWRLAEVLNPAVTIGFGIPDPGDNIFVGLSHEVQRNVQFYWGWHFGRLEVLRARTFDDPTDASAPPVDKQFRSKMFFGVAMNVNVIAKIFKIGL
jgi:hypothetical protein